MSSEHSDHTSRRAVTAARRFIPTPNGVTLMSKIGNPLACSLAPTAPAAHQFVARIWPYLCGAARRAAPRFGIEWEDLAHDFAAYLLEHFHDMEAASVEPMAFVVIRVKRVLDRGQLTRWRRMSNRPPLHTVPERWTEEDPVAMAEDADARAKLRVLLAMLSPRRRQAVGLRLGLDGSPPIAGEDLGRALGIRSTSAGDLVTSALKELAYGFGADVRFAGVSRAEGISLGQRAKIAREAAA